MDVFNQEDHLVIHWTLFPHYLVCTGNAIGNSSTYLLARSRDALLGLLLRCPYSIF